MPSDSAEDEAVEVMAMAIWEAGVFPGGPRFGELHRDDQAEVRKAARAAYAAYLSHVQSKMERIGVDPDGEVTEETKVRN